MRGEFLCGKAGGCQQTLLNAPERGSCNAIEVGLARSFSGPFGPPQACS